MSEYQDFGASGKGLRKKPRPAFLQRGGVKGKRRRGRRSEGREVRGPWEWRGRSVEGGERRKEG